MLESSILQKVILFIQQALVLISDNKFFALGPFVAVLRRWQAEHGTTMPRGLIRRVIFPQISFPLD